LIANLWSAPLLIKLQTNKSILSSWILGLFFLILIIGAIGSEFFQAPILTTQQFNRYRVLFKPEVLDGLQALTLKNRLGNFRVKKDDSGWSLTNPRLLPANLKTVNSLMSELTAMKIRTISTKDAINISNFSLDKPLLSIVLEDKNGKKQQLDMGLVNPIENTTYVSFKGKDAIYHIDSLKTSLEGLDLSDFVDSRIISLPATEFKKLTLYRGVITPKTKPRLSISKEKGQWKDSKGRFYQLDEINSYLKDLTELHSNLIIDKRSEKLNEQLEKYSKSPIYTLRVEDSKAKLYEITITTVINSLDGIKMEKRQNVIVNASNKKHPYLLNKSLLKLFNKSHASFKKLSAKTLFY
jgi:hypothetical protein